MIGLCLILSVLSKTDFNKSGDTNIALFIFLASLDLLSLLYIIANSLSRVEFRENGICINLSFIKWGEIKSYIWQPNQPYVFKIEYTSTFWLLPGVDVQLSVIIDVPVKHKDAVSHILNERLPDMRL